MAQIEAAAAARNLPPGFGSQAEYSVAVSMIEDAAASAAASVAQNAQVDDAPGAQPEVRGSRRQQFSVNKATADAIRNALSRAARAEEAAERHAAEKVGLREERDRALAENAKLRTASIGALDKRGPPSAATPSHGEAIQWLIRHQKSQPPAVPADGTEYSRGLVVDRGEASFEANSRALRAEAELAACRAELAAVRCDRDRSRAELQGALEANGDGSRRLLESEAALGAAQEALASIKVELEEV